MLLETVHWNNSVLAALTTYSGSRFRSGKELRGALNGFWTLLDAAAPIELEPLDSYRRAAEYEINKKGKLVPIEVDSLSRSREADQGEDTSSQGKDKEAKKLRRQMKKLAAAYVFSNLDCTYSLWGQSLKPVVDRPNPPGPVALSQLSTHTSPEILFHPIEGSSSSWMLTANSGYCMARTTHGIDRGGRWYFEVTIETPTQPDGHVRLGWAQILAQTEGPVGFDEHSYAIRDKDGATVHAGRPRPYAHQFGPGSVIGVFLETADQSGLDTVCDESKRAHIESEFPPLKFGNYLVKQEILAHGRISFAIDGMDFGLAFENIYHGKYYPAISLFNGGRAVLNIGPRFLHAPHDPSYRPVCDIAANTP